MKLLILTSILTSMHHDWDWDRAEINRFQNQYLKINIESEPRYQNLIVSGTHNNIKWVNIVSKS